MLNTFLLWVSIYLQSLTEWNLLALHYLELFLRTHRKTSKKKILFSAGVDLTAIYFFLYIPVQIIKGWESSWNTEIYRDLHHARLTYYLQLADSWQWIIKESDLASVPIEVFSLGLTVLAQTSPCHSQF